MSCPRFFAAFAIAACLGCEGEGERAPTRVILPQQAEAEVVSTGTSSPQPSAAPERSAPHPAAESVPDAAEVATAETNVDSENVPSGASEVPSNLPRLFGRITVDGTPPALSPLAVGAAAAMCNVPSVPDDSIVVGTDGGLANCVVYLKSIPDGATIPPVPGEPLIVDQRGCRFIPHVSLVRVGQLVLYRNSEQFSHNIRILPFDNPGFSETAGPGDDLDRTFGNAENRPMMFKCDLHTFMVGYQVILDHPWCGITDESGHFEISGLPEGELEFVAWHERKGYIERRFTLRIDAGSDIERNYQVAASDLAD